METSTAIGSPGTTIAGISRAVFCVGWMHLLARVS